MYTHIYAFGVHGVHVSMCVCLFCLCCSNVWLTWSYWRLFVCHFFWQHPILFLWSTPHTHYSVAIAHTSRMLIQQAVELILQFLVFTYLKPQDVILSVDGSSMIGVHVNLENRSKMDANPWIDTTLGVTMTAICIPPVISLFVYVCGYVCVNLHKLRVQNVALAVVFDAFILPIKYALHPFVSSIFAFVLSIFLFFLCTLGVRTDTTYTLKEVDAITHKLAFIRDFFGSACVFFALRYLVLPLLSALVYAVVCKLVAHMNWSARTLAVLANWWIACVFLFSV